MKYKLRDILGITGIFVFILTFAISLTIWAVPLYQFSLNHLNVPERVGMTYDQIMENYYVLMEYLHLPWVDTLLMPDFPVSASGAFHFYEVKLLFYLNFGLLGLSLVNTFFYWRKLKKEVGFWKLIDPFKVAIFVPFVLLLILALDFDWMFVMFHEIVFNNDAWIFNAATDPIITVLPQEFFMYCFVLAFTLIEASFIGGYFYFKKKAYK